MKAANSLRSLHHDNVVRFRGYCCRPSSLIFEYCHVDCDENIIVHSLKQLINVFNDCEYFNLHERNNYIVQACKGLQYLHNKDIIHRDIKPSNILVDGHKENIVVKLAD